MEIRMFHTSIKTKITLIIVTLLAVGCSTSAPSKAPTLITNASTATLASTPTASPVPSATPTLTPTPIPLPTGLPDGTLANGLGVSIHYMFSPVDYLPDAQYVLLQQSGVRIVRDDLTWASTEYDNNKYIFFPADELVSKMAQLEIRVLFILDYPN